MCPECHCKRFSHQIKVLTAARHASNFLSSSLDDVGSSSLKPALSYRVLDDPKRPY